MWPDVTSCVLCVRVVCIVSVRLTSSLVSLFSLSRGSCLTCVAMAKAARSWLSAKLMTLVMDGNMDPWQLVPMMEFRSHTASRSYQTCKKHINAWVNDTLGWEMCCSLAIHFFVFLGVWRKFCSPQCTVWSRSGCPWPPSSESSRCTAASRIRGASWRHQTLRRTLLWWEAGCSEGPTGRLVPT